MQTHIQKWGNSLGVRIPQAIIQKLSLSAGSAVDVTIENDHIILTAKKYDLATMLKSITEENIPDFQWDDSKAGKEEW